MSVLLTNVAGRCVLLLNHTWVVWSKAEPFKSKVSGSETLTAETLEGETEFSTGIGKAPLQLPQALSSQAKVETRQRYRDAEFIVSSPLPFGRVL